MRSKLSAENFELKIKVAKLSCDFEEIKSKGMITDSPEQLLSEKKTVSVSTEMKNSNIAPEQIDLQTENVSASDISDDTSNSDNTPDLLSEHNLVQSKETKSQVSNSTKLPEDVDDDSAEILDFVERVSNMMREKNREKRLQAQETSFGGQDISKQKNNQSKSQNASSSSLQNPISQSKDDLASKLDQSKIKSPCPEPKLSTDQAQSVIPELSDIPSQIAEASTLVQKIPKSHLAHLFGKAEKTGIKREYLRKMTQKARTISNSEDIVNKNNEFSSNTEVSASSVSSSNPVHAHANFRKKTLEQYPDILNVKHPESTLLYQLMPK